MAEEKERGHVRVDTAGVIGPIWFFGWLFTLAFAQLSWWQAIVGIIIWPYFLGSALR